MIKKLIAAFVISVAAVLAITAFLAAALAFSAVLAALFALAAVLLLIGSFIRRMTRLFARAVICSNRALSAKTRKRDRFCRRGGFQL